MENRCVICGATIPEGKQVCPNCEERHGTIFTIPEVEKREKKLAKAILQAWYKDCKAYGVSTACVKGWADGLGVKLDV